MTPKINLWLLTTEFPPYVGGGIGTYCTEFVECSRNAGISITVFVSDWSAPEPVSHSTHNSAKIIRFNPGLVCPSIGFSGTSECALAFHRIVGERIEAVGPPDLIEAQDYLAVSYFILQNKLTGDSRFTGIPIAITLHSPDYTSRSFNSDTSYSLPNFWNDEMERFCIGAADVLWSPSELQARTLGKALAGRPVEIIRNPLRQHDSEPDHEADEGIFFFGRIQLRKGVLPLLAAYAMLVDEGLRVPLTLIGGDSTYPGTGRSLIEFIQKRYGHLVEQDLLQITGILPREDAMTRLRRARVVAIPSLSENYAYAALEMMSLQRVVVTSSACGHSEIIEDGLSGLLFDHTDPTSLPNALRRALAMDENARAAVGQRARASVASHSDPIAVAKHKADAILRAIASHQPSRTRFPFLRQEAPVETTPPSEVGDRGLLTIVIPYFNLGIFLPEAIESALRINYPNKEILVLNASSTTPASVAAYYSLREQYASDSAIRFEHIYDQGLADTRNRGAELAHGEFLAFLDPYDLVHPDYYSRAIPILQQYQNVGAVGCWVKYFEGDTGQWITWNAEPPYFLFHNLINTASAVFRRSLFLSYAKNDLRMFVGMEDYEAMISLVTSGYGAVAIPDFLFNYRVRADSMMRRLSRKNDIYSYELIAEKHAATFSRYAVELTGLLNANGPGYIHDNPTARSNVE